jgi:hypothetical protein
MGEDIEQTPERVTDVAAPDPPGLIDWTVFDRQSRGDDALMDLQQVVHFDGEVGDRRA